MIIYKVSFVVAGRRDVGAVHSLSQEPELGHQVRLGSETFEVVELMPLMPARKDTVYLQAVCQPVVVKPNNLHFKPWLPVQVPELPFFGGRSTGQTHSAVLIREESRSSSILVLGRAE